MSLQIVVVAKEPLPGKVKTRLQPFCSARQAARIAEAALADTLAVVDETPAERRILLLDGRFRPPSGWEVHPQHGDGLGARLANGFTETAHPGLATLLIGMDTPQITPALLLSVANGLSMADAMLGMAHDGGWWVLALRDPHRGKILSEVPMSQPDTGDLTRQALAQQGLCVNFGPVLRDVDTVDDLRAVSALCRPDSHFARATATLGFS